MLNLVELKELIAAERAKLEYDLPPHTSAPAIQRFAAKVLIAPLNDCWLWGGSRSKIGYGFFRWDSRKSSPHRFIHEYFNGRIPAGLEIDHKCRVRACCNPEHLRAVTHKENQAALIRETCKRGHDNWRPLKNGKRVCGTCLDASNKRFHERHPDYVAPSRRPNSQAF